MRAAIACLACGCGQATAQELGGGRELQVLAVLERVAEKPGSWFSQTTFVRSRNAFESPVVVPHIPISCGNSLNGYFDAERARQLALELFRAYGLTPFADQVIHESGVATKLDGYDGMSKLGFKLRSDTAPTSWISYELEEDATALSADEYERLAAGGIRLHVANLADYPRMDGDQFTPTLAYLAGVVEFLNATTEGADVDLQATLQPRVQRFPFPAEFALPPEVNLEREDYGLRLDARESVQVIIPIEISSLIQVRQGGPRNEAWHDVDKALLTAGRPSLLTLRAHEFGGAVAQRTSVSQAGPGAVQVDSASGVVFLPSAFDASQPFAVTLTLSRGENRISPYVFVSVGE